MLLFSVLVAFFLAVLAWAEELVRILTGSEVMVSRDVVSACCWRSLISFTDG